MNKSNDYEELYKGIRPLTPEMKEYYKDWKLYRLCTCLDGEGKLVRLHRSKWTDGIYKEYIGEEAD
jgi:hypothetical protein